MYVHSGSVYIKIVLKDLKTKYVKSLKSKKTPVNPVENFFYQFTYLTRSNSTNLLSCALDMQNKHWAG